MDKKNNKFFYSLLYPTLFVAILWIIKGYEEAFDISFAHYGLFPRKVEGLIGILTSPLIHGDIDHLLSNTIPLLILGTIIFYFYRDIAFQLFGWIYITTGLWVWAAALPTAYHIGASGLVYGFEGFLIFSGIIRRNPKLLALSLLVVFLYGSTVWGIFPLKAGVSWQSHLLGGVSGLMMAFAFRKEGPSDPTYDLGDDVENELIDVSPEQTGNEEPTPPPVAATPSYTIKMHYVPNNKEEE